MNITDVMIKKPVMSSPETTLNQLALMMWENNCGCIPIVNMNQEPIGIVTDRDIAMSSALRNMPICSINAEEVVESKPLFCCSEEDDISVAIDLMTKNKIRRVPVVNRSGKLIGMISMGDILACAEETSYEISRKAVDKMMKAVSGHHRNLLMVS